MPMQQYQFDPGAGGTESQDWASMLYRMYLRWAERRGFKVELLDYQPEMKLELKMSVFIIKGENAYGYLKVENGIRYDLLKNLLQFDSNGQKDTLSFQFCIGLSGRVD